MIIGKRSKQYVEGLKIALLNSGDELNRLESENKSLREEIINLEKQLNKRDIIKEIKKEERKDLEKKVAQTKSKLQQSQFIDFDGFKYQYGLEYKDVADIIGVSVSTLSNYRNDPSKMTPDRYKDASNKIMSYKRKHKTFKEKVIKG